MRALTEPGELTRWSCEEATCDSGTYRLIGRALPLGAMGGRLLEQGADRLQFAWPLGSTETMVTLTLEPVPQSGNPPANFTRVQVLHTGVPAEVLSARWPAESWACIWSLWLRHLAGWVERAEVVGPFHDWAGPFGRTVERSLELEASPERVWAAISDPAIRQRWLTVPLGQELRREEGRLLVTEFALDGQRTTVTWQLEALSGGRTRVTVREEGLTWAGIDNQVGWHEYLVALHEETAPPLIRQTTWIKASPSKVWPYVASQEGLRRWLSGNIEFEPVIGAPVAFFEHGGGLRGRVVALEPERRLAFTWTELDAPGWQQDPGPTLLTITLSPEAGGTRVTLTHSGFENLPEAIWLSQFGSYQRGWSYGATMPRLKQVVEEAI